MQVQGQEVFTKRSNQFRYYTQLGMLFLGCYITANVIAPKPILIGSIVVPAGLIIFPLTYLLGALITEVYGFAMSRRVIWSALICNLVLALVCQIAIALPHPSDWSYQQEYALIFGASSRVMVISVFTYFIGELINAYIVARLKVKMLGKNFWLRGICGNWIGEGVETSIFIPLVFYYLPITQIVHMALFYFIFKVCYAFCAMPIMQLVAKIIKRCEAVEIYDRQIKFFGV